VEAAYKKTIFPTDDLSGIAGGQNGPCILHRNYTNKKHASKVSWELYNLEEDPLEAKNLTAAQPERVRSMRKALDSWQRSVIGSLNGEDYK
jgi:hypothetical protein